MSTTSIRTKTQNTCHNSLAGCKNQCEPGMNFCPKCMAFFGMTGKKSAITPGKYRHPLIGVGAAAQAHLGLPVNKESLQNSVTQKQQERKPVSEKSQATKRKTSETLKEINRDDPRTGVFFSGWPKKVLEAEAMANGQTLKQYVMTKLIEGLPADVVKAGMLADMKRKGAS